jgi:DNA repair photolyase
MEIIHESSGKVKEYAPLVLDLYENNNGELKPVEKALENLALDAALLNSQKDLREILVIDESDPFPDRKIVAEINKENAKIMESDSKNDTKNVTTEAIKILMANELKFSLLTEKIKNAFQHLDLIKEYRKARYGTKLLSNANGEQLNLDEPPILFRIESLKEANKRGIKTWVDLDPSFEPKLLQRLVRELFKVVDQWKVNGSKFDIKPASKSDWVRFKLDSEELFNSLGIRSSWTEGDISSRKGNCNILVIAPHGHPMDDAGTYKLARKIADELNCYAVVNEKYRKPQNAGLKKPSVRKWAADLNSWPHINKFRKIRKQFFEPIEKYKDEIIAEHDSLVILHIHGIGDDNRERAAQLLPEFKDNPEDLHLLIGYGQHRTQKDRKTADVNKLVNPMISELHQAEIKSVIAPTKNIIDKNGIKRWYCGNHKKKLNQKLCDPKEKVQSLQLEFKDGGFRDNSKNIKEAALKISKAVKAVLRAEDKDQNQNAVVSEAIIPKMHEIYTDFMAIIQRKSETTMLEAGRYLFKTFYNNEINVAKKKKEPLNSLHKYIQDLHGKDPVAPKKSWIYNSVKLVVEYKELKVYLKDDFHMYGNNLNLSQKVLLLTENDLEKKVQFIRETSAFIEKSGEHLTFLEFKRRFIASGLGKKGNGTNNPSLLRVIDKPEKLFSDDMSKFLTPEALKQLPSSKFEKLQARIVECVSDIEGKIKIQTEYLTRYKEISDTLEKVAKDKAEKAPAKAQPKLKTVTPVIISASRATDIPAFHSEWFFNRLREGYCIWKNPYGGGKDRVSFKSTRLIVFWTKNPKPILPRLKELDEQGLNYYFLYTLNDYEAENLEPNLPTLDYRIETFRGLSDTIGKKRVVWRFDPLVLTDQITKEQLAEKVSKIGNQLKGFTEKLVVSFAKVEQHRKVKNNLKKEGIKHLDFTETDINYVANQLAQFGNEFEMKVGACAEKYDLTKFGIERNKCIDDEFIKNVFSNDAALMDYMGNGGSQKHQGQRQLCGCIASKDIGAYDTCKYFCKYCYATVSQKTVSKNFKYKIDPSNESLLGD